MKKYLLSIIIPTKNRYDTLSVIVDTLLRFDTDELEIVVQDNSADNSSFSDYLNKHNGNSRFKYFYNSEKLSVIENSDLAVINSTGEYVCFIGDDDGVLPYIINVVKWMKINGIEILKGSKPTYLWPGMPTTSTSGDKNGVLIDKKYSYKTIKKDNAIALNYSLKKGGTSMELLPCLYHGIVARITLNKIFNKTKTFFPGPSPDMANATAITLVAEGYTFVDFPIVISGKSVNSTGGEGVKHNHVNHINDVVHLPKNTSKDWSPIIPKYWTGPTIWAESLLKALESFDEVNLMKKFNINYLLATIYVFHFKQRKQILKGYAFPVDYSILNLIKYLTPQLLNRARFFVKNRFFYNRSLAMEDVTNIDFAIEKMMTRIEFEKLPFKVKSVN